MPCSITLEVNRRYGEICRLHLQVRRISQARSKQIPWPQYSKQMSVMLHFRALVYEYMLFSQLTGGVQGSWTLKLDIMQHSAVHSISGDTCIMCTWWRVVAPNNDHRALGGIAWNRKCLHSIKNGLQARMIPKEPHSKPNKVTYAQCSRVGLVTKQFHTLH
jgi:hypothetical protein